MGDPVERLVGQVIVFFDPLPPVSLCITSPIQDSKADPTSFLQVPLRHWLRTKMAMRAIVQIIVTQPIRYGPPVR